MKVKSKSSEKTRAECALICDLATDREKRELVDRLASHLTRLADQIEEALCTEGRRLKAVLRLGASGLMSIFYWS